MRLLVVTEYELWPEGDNCLNGSLKTYQYALNSRERDHGGTVAFTCATEVVPATTWRALSVTTGAQPPGDLP